MSPSVGTRQAATSALRIVHLLRALHQGFLLVCAIKKGLSFPVIATRTLIEAMP
jgi:hypothetical protein